MELTTDQLIEKGTGLWKSKQVREAMECFDLAIQQSPTSGPAWNNKGKLLAEIGDFTGASDCIQQLLTRCELSEKQRRRYAWGWWQRYRPKQLRDSEDRLPDERDLFYVNASLALDPSDITFNASKSKILTRLGRTEEAAAAVLECGRHPPERSGQTRVWVVAERGMGWLTKLALEDREKYWVLAEVNHGITLCHASAFRPHVAVFIVWLSDVPAMLELSNQVRNDEALSQMPVVFCTNVFRPGKENQTVWEGRPTLGLPFEIPDLVSLIEENLPKEPAPG